MKRARGDERDGGGISRATTNQPRPHGTDTAARSQLTRDDQRGAVCPSLLATRERARRLAHSDRFRLRGADALFRVMTRGFPRGSRRAQHSERLRLRGGGADDATRLARDEEEEDERAVRARATEKVVRRTKPPARPSSPPPPNLEGEALRDVVLRDVERGQRRVAAEHLLGSPPSSRTPQPPRESLFLRRR